MLWERALNTATCDMTLNVSASDGFGNIFKIVYNREYIRKCARMYYEGDSSRYTVTAEAAFTALKAIKIAM